jgi:pimeloyl-ACP methyl ester carboxylesterase
MRLSRRLGFTLCLAGALAVGVASAGQAQKNGQGDKGPLVIAKFGNFFVGGSHNANDQMVGAMYVEYVIPQNQTQRYPIILVHGGGQIGAGWSQTLDGREGWTQYFVRRGFAVYVVDQPARGRSAYHSQLGALGDVSNATRAQSLWAAIERFNFWPAARLHTQWVGPAVNGDPTFEQFLSSQSDALTNAVLQEQLTADGLVALLDRIGPSIVIPHSQPGAPAWLVVDRRPNLVKALIQLEPGGPPVARDEPSMGFAPGPTFAWGLTRTTITYSPAVSDPAQLSFIPLPKDPGIATCWVQASPARQLPNLQRVPIMLLSSPSGYNTAWDPCTVKYLRQAGVDANFTWLKLQEIGIQGNGHFMFVERNSDQIAGVVLDWIQQHVQTKKSKKD